MNIENIVEQALKEGYLTPTMEAEVGKICDSSAELSLEEYMALDRLMLLDIADSCHPSVVFKHSDSIT